MKYRSFALAGCVAASVAVASPAQAAPAIQITKIQYNSPGTDTDENKSLNGEWVRIKNTASSSKTLTGWTLRDAADHIYTFPATTLGAGASLYVHTGSGSNSSSRRYWGQDWHVWNNSGEEKVRLKNKSGTLIDSCDYKGTDDGFKTC